MRLEGNGSAIADPPERREMSAVIDDALAGGQETGPEFMMIEITMNCDGGHRNARATGLN